MVDLEKIKTIYKIGKKLQWADIQLLVKSAKSKTYAPSEYILKEHSTKKDIFFITKGLIRIFAINKKGDEITVGLRKENQPIANSDSVIFNRPSRFYIQALEETKILTMNYDDLESIISKNIKLEQARKDILIKMLEKAQERIESFILYSPEERYLHFIEKNVEIINRVPGKYIASILGITPVSLSRIRKRIASKKNKPN